jgi:hypothetical protein
MCVWKLCIQSLQSSLPIFSDLSLQPKTNRGGTKGGLSTLKGRVLLDSQSHAHLDGHTVRVLAKDTSERLVYMCTSGQRLSEHAATDIGRTEGLFCLRRRLAFRRLILESERR